MFDSSNRYTVKSVQRGGKDHYNSYVFNIGPADNIIWDYVARCVRTDKAGWENDHFFYDDVSCSLMGTEIEFRAVHFTLVLTSENHEFLSLPKVLFQPLREDLCARKMIFLPDKPYVIFRFKAPAEADDVFIRVDFSQEETRMVRCDLGCTVKDALFFIICRGIPMYTIQLSNAVCSRLADVFKGLQEKLTEAEKEDEL